MNSRIFLSTTLSIAMIAASSAFAGDVTGKVKLEGKAPPEKPIKFDPECKKLHKAEVNTSHYVTDAQGGLANVFVYVKDGLAGKKFPAPTTPVLLDQVNCIYTPYVVGVQVGQPLIVQNSDPFLHNVHVVPFSDKPLQNAKPLGGRDNIGQPNKGMKNEAKFDKPEVFVKFKCDVHPWMLAFVGVVDHPFFAVTGPDGSFKLNGLPDGEYTLAAHHPKAGEQTMKIKVAGAAPATADFKFAPKTAAAAQ